MYYTWILWEILAYPDKCFSQLAYITIPPIPPFDDIPPLPPLTMDEHIDHI